MSIKQHEPITNTPELMSEAKRKWWGEIRSKAGSLKQPRVCVLQHAMNTTPRPTNTNESIALGYMNGNKFHDREPDALMTVILGLDPNFFDSYPKKQGTIVDADFIKSAIGEAARCFYRHGLSAYGKPGLRSDSDYLSAI